MNETQKYKVIKAVVENKKRKQRACVELGLSIRQINRLVSAYKLEGKSAFSHGNRGVVSKHSVPFEIKKRIIEIYQTFNIRPNVTHFSEILKEEHGITYTDTTIRRILYQACLISPKSQRKTRKRLSKETTNHQNKTLQTTLIKKAEDQLELPEKAHPSRPRMKYRGELIQMDASSFSWFGHSVTHLHLAIDDASGNIVGAYFDTQETLKGYYNVLNQILTKQGIPVAFLTDKRTVFEYRSKKMKRVEEDTFTQFGFTCHQLGIDIKTSSIPQAKGRVERLNASVQSRLPVDLELAGIETIGDANQFLKKWIQTYNRKFGNKTKESVFEKAPSEKQLNLLLARVANRKVDGGHHVRYQNTFYLPIEGRKEKYFTRKSDVLVIEAFNGDIYLNIEEKIYESKKLLSHELYSKELDCIPETKKERHKYIPPQTHPWKLESFKRYLRSIDSTLEDYEASKIA